MTQSIQDKYYSIYRTYFTKYATAWAQKVKNYAKRRDAPFGVAFRQIDGAMRRYLGLDEYERYGDLMIYLAIKDGLYCKDAKGNIDITEKAFYEIKGE